MTYYVLTLELGLSVGNGVITAHPAGMPIKNFEFSKAAPLAERFPSGASYAFSPDYPEHRAVCDLQANTLGLFVVSGRMREILAAELLIEYLPIRLLNHRGETVSDTHSIANFLDPVDCIDRAKSTLDLSNTHAGRIDRIRSLVLDTQRIPDNRHAFRLSGSARTVVVRSEMRAKFEAAGLTGLVLAPSDQFDSALHVGV